MYSILGYERKLILNEIRKGGQKCKMSYFSVILEIHFSVSVQHIIINVCEI